MSSQVSGLAFLGAIYNATGRSLDPTIPDLTEGKLVEYPHRSMVARDGAAPISQVWLLADDATFAAVPPLIVAEAVNLVLGGKGIVILARRLELAVDVRDGLLDALDLMGKTADMAGFTCAASPAASTTGTARASTQPSPTCSRTS